MARTINRDDEPGYIFCDAETKVKLDELARTSGVDTPSDDVFVVADIIPHGFYVVTTKAEFLGWLFNRDNNHDVWTVPEKE